ncbi:retron Ec78 anti-phage system effector HNH endonuclease PtuB [Chromobacterium piscinae]|uniref:retron Ec78 anti-phage system effector HNH endonuclease PtuB n=1 Tax=Chromobacterium piscinae TaxID=686831 RepID=UPI0032099A05
MKKLNRPQSKPTCLNKLHQENKKWDLNSPNKHDRVEIWAKLEEMQGNFCCYCESALSESNRHIEHFFPKGRRDENGDRPYENMTYEWSNLFGSCGKKSGVSCGHFKDKEGNAGPGDYNVFDLIKPDIEDPSEFLKFSQAGSIFANPNLHEDISKRAKETIRVLNLNHPALIAARQRLIEIFRTEIDDLIELNLPEPDFKQAISELRHRVVRCEFSSAVISSIF